MSSMRICEYGELTEIKRQTRHVLLIDLVWNFNYTYTYFIREGKSEFIFELVFSIYVFCNLSFRSVLCMLLMKAKR